MKLRCIIIDDEPVARKVLEEFIEDIDFLELVAQAENPLKASQILDSDDIDVIFLDVTMPKISGIDFLKNTRTSATVIMTTAYIEYAVEAFGLNVLDYLVKPIAFDRFLKACLKAKEVAVTNEQLRLGQQPIAEDNYFFVKCDNQIEKVYYNDLIYAEAMLNYVMLHTSTKKMMVYITIKSLENQLPESLFVKVHKSFIVNQTKVQSIEGNILDMGKAKITISQNLREKALQQIIRGKMLKR